MNIFKARLILVAFIIIVPSVRAANYEILVDQYYSPYTGASLLSSTYNFYKFLDDRYLPSSVGKEDFTWQMMRLSKFGLDFLLSNYFLVIEHEIFGHGYRAREYHFQNVYYNIEIFSGYTAYSWADYNSINNYQKNAIKAAGMEANTVFSQQIRLPWFGNQFIDHRDAVAYILNQTGALNYVYTNHSGDGNDVNNYIAGVNNYYENNNTLSRSKMRSAILVDLLDPALYYCLYALGDYLATGATGNEFFMFKVGGYQYLPAAATILAPWGLEFQWQNFIKTKQQQLLQINIRAGSNQNINSFGLDFYWQPIWKYRQFEIGNQLSMWYQPNMNAANAKTASMQLGIAEFVNITYKAQQGFSLLASVGFKSSGFMQGFVLNDSVILRLGCGW